MNSTSANTGHQTTGEQRWTDQQLELYHDAELGAELDAATSEALARDLLADAALRARFSALTSIDRRARRALLAPPLSAHESEGRRHRSWRLELAIAGGAGGAVALAAATAMMIWPAAVRPPESPTPHQTPLAAGGEIGRPSQAGIAADLERAGVRVLASLPGPGKNAGSPRVQRPTRARSTFAAATEIPAVEPTLRDLLDVGDVDGFLSRTRQASGEDRDAAFGLLGGTLRSAMTAQRVLDGLTPEEQLTVCTVWAHEPHLRPVTFERLALLQERPELRERVATLAAELSRSRELLAWVKSYRLEPAPGASPPGPRAG